MKKLPAFRPTILLAVLAATILTACGGSGEEASTPGAPAPEDSVVAQYQFSRDYIFLSTDSKSQIVVPLTISATDAGEQLQRQWMGWVARGAQWERFLEESRLTSRAGGVWGVLPSTDLRVFASGPVEVESFLYERAGRRLRISIGEQRTDWNQGGDNRFRLLNGTVAIGAEVTNGVIFEGLRVERAESDGWPAAHEIDVAFLTSGDGRQFLVSNATTEDAALTWIHTPTDDLLSSDGEVARLELQTLEEARRDIPVSWTLSNPSLGLSGEIAATGRDVILGPERGGRRVVEIHYSVEGTVEVNGQSWPVTGIVRHAQM
jgi:hypothetical protein